MRGYGTGCRKRSLLEKSKRGEWLKNREGYIKAMGYKLGYEDYPVTNRNLTAEEKVVFEQGYTSGVSKKTLLEDTVFTFKKVRK